MEEKDVIAKSTIPQTCDSLAADMRRLGVEQGMTLLVHSSLTSLGWVCGGPVSVIQALMKVLVPGGTLVMPTHVPDNSDPVDWVNPPVPRSWHQVIRDNMPAFDPQLTPSSRMGCIPELFRTWPGVRRSYHPQVSFAAWGRHAQQVTDNHSLEFGLGEGSPLARIYELDGYVLLLGVGYGNNTSFHLAECRTHAVRTMHCGAAIMENGHRVWKTYQDLDYDSDDFPEIGLALERAGLVKTGRVGLAHCRLFSLPAAVDFAQTWLSEHRT